MKFKKSILALLALAACLCLFPKHADAQAGQLACILNGNVTVCPPNATGIVGVFNRSGQTSSIVSSGQATVNLATAATTTLGDYACSNGTSGTVIDNGVNPCPSGQQAGLIFKSNFTAVSSVLVNLSTTPIAGATGTLVCVSGSSLIACPTNGTGIAGVFQAGGSIATVNTGGYAVTNLAVFSLTTLGDFACSSTLAGAIVDNGKNTCQTGQQAGFIGQTNTNPVTTVPVYLTTYLGVPGPPGPGGSANIQVNGSSVPSANLNGTVPSAPSCSENVGWGVSGSSVSASLLLNLGNNCNVIDASTYSTIQAAVNACVTTPCTVIIPPTDASANAATIPSSVFIQDWRATGEPSGLALGCQSSFPTSLYSLEICGPAGGGLYMTNGADAALSLQLNSGLTAAQLTQVFFADRGTHRFAMAMDAAGSVVGDFAIREVSVGNRFVAIVNGDNQYSTSAYTNRHRFYDSVVMDNVVTGQDPVLTGTCRETSSAVAPGCINAQSFNTAGTALTACNLNASGLCWYFDSLGASNANGFAVGSLSLHSNSNNWPIVISPTAGNNALFLTAAGAGTTTPATTSTFLNFNNSSVGGVNWAWVSAGSADGKTAPAGTAYLFNNGNYAPIWVDKTAADSTIHVTPLGVSEIGHISTHGSAPTITGSGCSLTSGNDRNGTIAATGSDACVVTFYAAYTAPVCMLTPSAANMTPAVTGLATTYLHFSTAATGNVFYHCEDVF